MTKKWTYSKRKRVWFDLPTSKPHSFILQIDKGAVMLSVASRRFVRLQAQKGIPDRELFTVELWIQQCLAELKNLSEP